MRGYKEHGNIDTPLESAVRNPCLRRSPVGESDAGGRNKQMIGLKGSISNDYSSLQLRQSARRCSPHSGEDRYAVDVVLASV